jgi:hypothetical protein
MTAPAPARPPRAGRSKSRLLAITLSGLFPGLGQLYNGDPWRGLAFAVAGALTAFGPLNPLEVEIDIDDPVQGLRNVLLSSLPFLAVALWSAIDAWRRAVLPEER